MPMEAISNMKRQMQGKEKEKKREEWEESRIERRNQDFKGKSCQIFVPKLTKM